MNAGCADGMTVIGKIAFNSKEVLGRGSEGTFVYRSVLLYCLDVFTNYVYVLLFV